MVYKIFKLEIFPFLTVSERPKEPLAPKSLHNKFARLMYDNHNNIEMEIISFSK